MVQGSQARARATQKKALGGAIRRHRGKLSQGELALALGISQASVSSWELGGVDLTCEQVADIEGRLRLRPGTLLVEAGYIDPALIGADGVVHHALGQLERALRSVHEAIGLDDLAAEG
jgi:transcriptional regulator with XRE-family HTH domain